ncbi:MAG TPA: cob(I)yrinic acid a,c-diamide adenosyltransferase [Flavobacteriaceae bacterium]|jgi:cob(I)alamin adenosyltransferase|nr:cob(I)yrinic acid a,c-diamide adenosyltransferase [Flavobacteriaceae bacterium]HBS13049.1 cob(I)yrinic acid a,c-diamide adenosyltransferase [Flavobacteriaceae bacterium]
MKIYTKTGDKGKTSLYGGTRVLKNDLRIETYGTIDELNANIGLLKDQKNDAKTTTTLLKVQNELFTIGAMLATPPEKEKLKNGKKRLNIPEISEINIQFLEQEIDTIEKQLPPMTHFILPGGHQTVSFCHIARCVCRRAERLTVHLHLKEPINEIIIRYLNRLSDYLFVLARKLTIDNQAKEIPWLPNEKS